VERLLRPREACQLLGISYSTLLRWTREGKIRVVTTEGGKYRIPYGEIKKYLERRLENLTHTTILPFPLLPQA
jgi:putative resolvase